MLGLLKKSTNGNGSGLRSTIQDPSSTYHKFTPEELTQVKMIDLRLIMKDKGVHLQWLNNQYEGKCPFHSDPARAPRLLLNQKEGIWLWRCEGGHHSGTIIDFVQEAHNVNFPRAVEYLRQLIIPMPKLNGGGSSLAQILKPVLEEKMGDGRGRMDGKPMDDGRWKMDEKASPSSLVSLPSSLVSSSSLQLPTFNISDDTATFRYGDLIYQAKDLKGSSKHSLKIILKLTHQDSHFTDRIDLHSARARRSFANQASERLNLQSAQVEEHLEAMMESLEEILRQAQDDESQGSRGRGQEITEQEKQEAMALLKDPNLLDRMSQDLDRLGYVGESTNKKILYLVATSRLLDKPISAIIRSGSGAGKSALMEQVLSLMPSEDVLLFSRITPQSLFYMGQEALDRKILAIDEREGSQSADYSIRTLQSRGKLTLAASQKDPKSGEWKTLVREFAARTPYIESSTKEKLNEENLNRSFELYLDESPEQTKHILEAQRKSAAGIDQLNEEEKTKLKRLYQNAQRLLSPIEVNIPYELEVSIPQSWIRTRRDHERFLSLVKVITLVHQHQREGQGSGVKGQGDESSRFKVQSSKEATKEDAEIARDLLKPVIGELSSDLAKPIQSFYELLKKKVNEEAGSIAIEDFKFSRRDIRTWLGLPDHTVKRSLNQLEDLEYIVLKRGGSTTKKLYSLSGS